MFVFDRSSVGILWPDMVEEVCDGMDFLPAFGITYVVAGRSSRGFEEVCFLGDEEDMLICWGKYNLES